MLKLSNIKIYEDLDDDILLEKCLKKYNINKKDVLSWHILKKSIDARNKNDIHYNYSICVEVKNENKYKKLEKIIDLKDSNLKILGSLAPIYSKSNCNLDYNSNYDSNCDSNYNLVCNSNKTNNNLAVKSPIIIGAGPAGLFAALTFIENDIKPIIIEQGKTVEERQKDINNFTLNRHLNINSNVQFGEGGAGTFSDGKLTTGINSKYCKQVLKEFVRFGAPEEILYLAKPHIGTDKLISVIRNIREYIIHKGGKFYFNTKAIDFNIVNNKIKSVITKNVIDNQIQEFPAENLILAIGHSSRDTFYKIYEKGLTMEPKNFSVGVRIEHLQEEINKAQYGLNCKLSLPPADYKLSCHFPSGRSCYTFCMCPGGEVIGSSSEENTIVTNGMSTFARDGKNSNSAVLVNITPDDFKTGSPLEGINFQKNLETLAFNLGGKNYNAPVQRFEDFLNNVKSTKIGTITPSYKPGYTLSNLNDILPKFVSETLKLGILNFDAKLKGFANPDSILTGIETRSSSPVKIVRDETLNSNVRGIYPCGEGAGYAGGIMSASVDGIKCAISCIKNEL